MPTAWRPITEVLAWEPPARLLIGGQDAHIRPADLVIEVALMVVMGDGGGTLVKTFCLDRFGVDTARHAGFGRRRVAHVDRQIGRMHKRSTARAETAMSEFIGLFDLLAGPSGCAGQRQCVIDEQGASYRPSFVAPGDSR